MPVSHTRTRSRRPRRVPAAVLLGGALAFAVTLLLGSACTGDSAPDTAKYKPDELYRLLLNAPFTASVLPKGYRNATLGEAGPEEIDANDAAYKPLGEIVVDVEGPDAENAAAGMDYLVFPTGADARRHYDEAKLGEGLEAAGDEKAQNLPDPAKCRDAVIKSGDRSAGITFCQVLVGNVEIRGLTAARDAQKGDVAAANALTRAAYDHLKAVIANPPKNLPTATPTMVPKTATP